MIFGFILKFYYKLSIIIDTDASESKGRGEFPIFLNISQTKFEGFFGKILKLERLNLIFFRSQGGSNQAPSASLIAIYKKMPNCKFFFKNDFIFIHFQLFVKKNV